MWGKRKLADEGKGYVHQDDASTESAVAGTGDAHAAGEYVPAATPGSHVSWDADAAAAAGAVPADALAADNFSPGTVSAGDLASVAVCTDYDVAIGRDDGSTASTGLCPTG